MHSDLHLHKSINFNAVNKGTKKYDMRVECMPAGVHVDGNFPSGVHTRLRARAGNIQVHLQGCVESAESTEGWLLHARNELKSTCSPTFVPLIDVQPAYYKSFIVG